jgi:hypothetical protein
MTPMLMDLLDRPDELKVAYDDLFPLIIKPDVYDELILQKPGSVTAAADGSGHLRIFLTGRNRSDSILDLLNRDRAGPTADV